MARTRTRKRKASTKKKSTSPFGDELEAKAAELESRAAVELAESRTDDVPEFPEPERRRNGWSDRYVDAAGEIDGWAPAADVLDVVTSVRTVFPDFNRATTVGGLPVRRVHTVHGPTTGGKTAFVLGLVKSFADRGFLAGYIDAEHALDRTFAAELLDDLEGRPNFLAVRPDSYEQTIERTDTFLRHAAKAREAHPEAKSILIVDSINKLVPKRELDKILGKGKKGAEELTKAHHGRYRAALNQAWLDKLTPQIARAECALVIIAQERDDHDSTSFFRGGPGVDFKVKGGAALVFDSSLVIRVEKGQPIFLSGAEKKSNDMIAGFKHRIRIWKSKVGHLEGRHTDCFFHLSNGKLTTPGLDTARDALLVGSDLGIVKVSGSWFSYGGRRAQGENKAIEKLAAHPHRLTELLDDIAVELDKREGRVA